MSAESQGPSDRFGSWRRSFRTWRGQRPFWAGLLTLLGGLPIMYFPYANLTLGQLTIRMATTAGSGSLIIGVLLVVLGLTMWFQSAARIFAGVAAILLALVSLVVSNFGGFVAGFLMALIGGGMAVAWAPGAPITDAGASAAGPAPQPALAGAGTLAAEPAVQPAPAGDGGQEPAATAGRADEEPNLNGRHRAG